MVDSDANRLQISVAPTHAVVRLKAWRTDGAPPGRAIEIGGRMLPGTVGTTANGEPRLLCLGPGDWLAVSGVVSGGTLTKHLNQDRQRQDIAVVDVSHGLTNLKVAGPGWRDLLSRGCGLDLHPRALPMNHCAQTRLAMLAVILDHRQEDAIEVYVTRSYRVHLQNWLGDAMK